MPDSPAELCKKLSVGDKLLAVNGKDVTKLHHTDVVGIIKRSGLRVALRVVTGKEKRTNDVAYFNLSSLEEEEVSPPEAAEVSI